MDSPKKNIQLNDDEKNCVYQVFPNIGSTIDFPQRPFPLNLILHAKEEEINPEEADTEVTLARDDSMSCMVQLIRKDFEAMKYFSQKRNRQSSISESSAGKIVDKKMFENISENRKSVIFHTSDLKECV